MKTTKESTVTYGTATNVRAARGQAVNLAVQDAIAQGKQEDNNYICTRFLHYYKLAALLQEIDLEDLQKEVSK